MVVDVFLLLLEAERLQDALHVKVAFWLVVVRLKQVLDVALDLRLFALDLDLWLVDVLLRLFSLHFQLLLHLRFFKLLHNLVDSDVLLEHGVQRSHCVAELLVSEADVSLRVQGVFLRC